MGERKRSRYPSFPDEYLTGLEQRLQLLLEETPVLADVAKFDTEELKDIVLRESGKGILIILHRESEGSVEIVIPRNSSVNELKKAVGRKLNLLNAKQRRINWKYIWQKHNLAFGNQQLTNDLTTLEEYDLENSSVVTFVRKPRKRKPKKAGKRKNEENVRSDFQ
ncbi:U11/U12 small nuclear ribonucleoprotein 25 kDa protein-like [Paramacrobiotus metropolitanus]|uniref:U11/U12 small nuclear ribonucleoprotein 25 kDa protein-like n=1 Tax=Paramacrobiotus metropolitanus TaxID=2943436 RepID=UPI0024456630|nr:U11/U12 small nuclear ribonucleoprotein 25 kDa protein-like [Paramacrobiotus metropolitanus]